jgi:lipopolysaccharide transport protein LptA
MLAAIAAALAAPPSRAQMTGSPGPFQGFKSTDKTPIEIRADRMEADLTSGRLRFIGRVSAKQGKRVIYAERMEVNYTDQGGITVLEAKGNVKVSMDQAFATADRLVLDNTKQVIRLLGSPRVVQGRQVIVGKKITYEIGTEKLTVSEPRIEWMPEKAGPETDKSTPVKDESPGNEPSSPEGGGE